MELNTILNNTPPISITRTTSPTRHIPTTSDKANAEATRFEWTSSLSHITGRIRWAALETWFGDAVGSYAGSVEYRECRTRISAGLASGGDIQLNDAVDYDLSEAQLLMRKIDKVLRYPMYDIAAHVIRRIREEKTRHEAIRILLEIGEKLVAMRWERIVFLSLLLISLIATSVCISYGNMRGIIRYIPINVCLLHPRGVHAIFKLFIFCLRIKPKLREIPCSNRTLDFIADDQALEALTLFYSRSGGHSALGATAILKLLEPRQKRCLFLVAQALPSGDIWSFMAYSLSPEAQIMVIQSLREEGITWSDIELLRTELEMWLETEEEIV